MTPEYNPETGKLRLLKYASDGDGKVDTVSYMDGSRVVKIEIAKDEDGKEDAWSYADATGAVRPDGTARVEVDVKGDGHFVLANGAAAARK
jgi:hypothetical protein